ncbi:hypothetical protein LXL04_026584 [Taraxacum kok-saghyz]
MRREEEPPPDGLTRREAGRSTAVVATTGSSRNSRDRLCNSPTTNPRFGSRALRCILHDAFRAIFLVGFVARLRFAKIIPGDVTLTRPVGVSSFSNCCLKQLIRINNPSIVMNVALILWRNNETVCNQGQLWNKVEDDVVSNRFVYWRWVLEWRFHVISLWQQIAVYTLKLILRWSFILLVLVCWYEMCFEGCFRLSVAASATVWFVLDAFAPAALLLFCALTAGLGVHVLWPSLLLL